MIKLFKLSVLFPTTKKFLPIQYVLDTELSSVYTLLHVGISTHFMEGKPEAQRSAVTYPRSHS